MTEAKETGAQFGAWRERAGLTQDQVAAVARERGLRWTRATVAAIELGRRALALSEFVALRGQAIRADELATVFERAKEIRTFKGESAEHLDAEIKAARRLGVEPAVIVATARRVWGITLTEKRDRILQENIHMDGHAREYWAKRGVDAGLPRNARDLRATRGHITRVLVGELRAALAGKPLPGRAVIGSEARFYGPAPTKTKKGKRR